MIKLALCQMSVVNNKEENLNKAASMISKAAKEGAHIAVLPEMFNCPYDNSYFAAYAEEGEGQTYRHLSVLAQENDIMIIGGSIPEMDDGRIYNTSYVFNRSGACIGKYRKMHLFDIDVTDGVCFKESDSLTAGEDLLICDTEYGKIGIAICYDIRFPELSRLMTLAGAQMIVLPGAFNMTTGPAHWSLSIRMRALDNQLYFIGVSPARDMEASYIAYGHSMIANPWGETVIEGDEREQIFYGEIDLEQNEAIRKQLPLLAHRRANIYKLIEENRLK